MRYTLVVKRRVNEITPLMLLTGCLALSKIEVIMLYSVVNVLFSTALSSASILCHTFVGLSTPF
jgi:hypothetical protein